MMATEVAAAIQQQLTSEQRREICLGCSYLAWAAKCKSCGEPLKVSDWAFKEGKQSCCKCHATDLEQQQQIKCYICKCKVDPVDSGKCPKGLFLVQKKEEPSVPLGVRISAQSSPLPPPRPDGKARVILPVGCDWRERWAKLFGSMAGKTILVVASGPSSNSLTEEDYKAADLVLVTNWAWRIAGDWSDIMVSTDTRPLKDLTIPKWLTLVVHGRSEIGRKRRLALACAPQIYCFVPYYASPKHPCYHEPKAGGSITTAINSGYMAISLAIYLLGSQAGKIVVAGFDYTAKSEEEYYAYGKYIGHEPQHDYKFWKRDYERTYNRTNSRLPGMIQWAKHNGIEVVNKCDPKSPLTWGNGMGLNLGAGHKKKDGYLNVDKRPIFAEAGCCLDLTDVPYKLYGKVVRDGEIGAIYSSHSLEHVGRHQWRGVLAEWHRILRPGGKIEIRLPNCKKICESISKGLLDCDHLFGDQNYPENLHRCGFSPEKLTGAMEQLGFKIKKVRLTGKRCHNIIVIAKKKKTFLITNKARKLGDAIQYMALAAAAKQKYPDRHITMSFIKEAFAPLGKHCPDIDGVLIRDKNLPDTACTIRETQVSSFYKKLLKEKKELPGRMELVCRLKGLPFMLPRYQAKAKELAEARQYVARCGMGKNWIIFSPTAVKRRRSLTEGQIERIVGRLRGAGIGVMMTGLEPVLDAAITGPFTGMKKRFDVAKSMALHALAPLVVTVDTGSLHMAAAQGRPVLLLCGPVVPSRVCAGGYNGVQVIEAGIEAPCSGCQYWGFFSACRAKHCKYVAEEIKVDEVVSKVKEMLGV